MEYSSDLIGILLFVALAITINITCNFLIKKSIIIVLIGTFLPPFLFILITSLMNGFLDPFFKIVFVRISVLSFLFSLFVRIFFVLRQSFNKRNM